MFFSLDGHSLFVSWDLGIGINRYRLSQFSIDKLFKKSRSQNFSHFVDDFENRAVILEGDDLNPLTAHDLSPYKTGSEKEPPLVFKGQETRRHIWFQSEDLPEPLFIGEHPEILGLLDHFLVDPSGQIIISMDA